MTLLVRGDSSPAADPIEAPAYEGSEEEGQVENRSLARRAARLSVIWPVLAYKSPGALARLATRSIAARVFPGGAGSQDGQGGLVVSIH